jgi:hypothetical protein
MVTGHGAGFVMCWQNNVQLNIAEDEDPRNFMIVKSGSYVLAIPDLNHYARHEADAEAALRPDTASSVSSGKQRATFKKTVMKLNGNVRWGVGLVFERNLDDGGRSFNFIPHYNITLKNPKYVKAPNNKVSTIHVYSFRLSLIRISHMMHSEASAVTTFTCPSPLLLRTIENGLSPTWSRRRHITASIYPLDFSPTSTAGGLCSPVPCLCPYDRVNYGPGLKNPVRSSDDTWRQSSTTFCYHHYI